LHYPGAEKGKSRDFEQTVLRKYHTKDYDFRGVYFPNHLGFTFGSKKPEFTDDADFTGATFDGQVYFWDAKFHKKSKFDRATFNSYVTFKDATFVGEADFNHTTFKDTARFDNARFLSESSFQLTEFHTYAYFTDTVFSDSAHFLWTKFKSNSYFTDARFERNATFTGSLFAGEASFGGVDFRSNAYLNGIDFSDLARFTNATFSSTTKFDGSDFSGNVSFIKAKFQQNSFTQFIGARFHNHVRFVDTTFGDGAALNLTAADFEKPERVQFNSVTLHPYWFLNADSRKFSFVAATWSNVGPPKGVRNEIKELTSRGVERLHRLLSIACRNLAVNAEENHRYEEASNFRYMAMEALRHEKWRGFAFWRLSWWYWLASGYGERIPRALGVFLAVWLSFALLYRLPSPIRCVASAPERRGCISWNLVGGQESFFDSSFNSALYAFEVITLQKPEPRPKSPAARLAVTLCLILGPLQAALLALAIRRKFMR
jgi:hypothetical protein